jgi:cyclopropane fatty-acyl-phospholipid synthase-like methyltransferase
MNRDPVLDFWNARAGLAARAGSNDLIAKQLEIAAIAGHVSDGMAVAEFGCGNGVTAIELASRFRIRLDCFDFAPAMIDEARKQAEQAGVADRAIFRVADVRDQPDLKTKYDLIYTERMLINLSSWQEQSQTICYLVSLLRPGGRFLMCENSSTGLSRLNQLRLSCGLYAIEPPWHNKYLEDTLVQGLHVPGARLVAVEAFSATYYFLSRVVNAWLAAQEGREPTYDAPVNQLSLRLPPFGDCAQAKLWIFESTTL